MKKAYFNWSSGKDSALALYKALKSGIYDIQSLFTIIKKGDFKIAMHEIGADLLKRQAEAIGIPLTVLELDLTASSNEYKRSIKMQMEKFKERQINIELFGDLYLQELRDRRIENCKQQGIQAEFPLWNSNPVELLGEFISLGFKSIVRVDGAVELLEYLSEKYKIYVASNGPFEQQVQRMKLAKMDRYLSGYFVSEKIGHSKPEKAFFGVCYRETQVADLSELMMIGDSLSADIQGAKDYGMKACWFDKELKGTKSLADYMVNQLSEIKNFL